MATTKKAEIKASISMDDSSFQRGLRRAQTSAARFGQQVERSLSFGSLAARAGVALGGIFAASKFRDGIKGVLDAGERLKDLNVTTGLTVRSLSMLSDAFYSAQVPAEDLEKAVHKMQQSIYTSSRMSSTKLDPALSKMRVRFDDLQRMAPEDQFREIGKAIMELPTAVERTGAAFKIFRRSGPKLLEVFQDFQDIDFSASDRRAQFFERNAASFDRLNGAMRRAKLSFELFFGALAERMLPTLMQISKLIEGTDWEKVGKATSDVINKGPVRVGGDFGEKAREAFINGQALRLLGEQFKVEGFKQRQIAPRDALGRKITGPERPMTTFAPNLLPSSTGGIDAQRAKKFTNIPMGASMIEATSLTDRTNPTTRPFTLPSGLISSPTGYTGGLGGAKSGSLLSKKERDAIMDAQVAATGIRPGSTPGAFNAYRQGDVARRKEFLKEQERQRLMGNDQVVDKLTGIESAVKVIAGP